MGKPVKKTCSKAKREKEILHDLDVLQKRIYWLESEQEKNQERERGITLQRNLDQAQAAKRQLEQGLHDLWTASPKKRSARRR